MIEAKNSLSSFKGDSSNDELLEKIYADAPLMKELLTFGETKESIKRYLPVIAAYQESKAACAKCPGIDKCPEELSHYVNKLVILDSGRIGLEVGYCDKYLEKERMKSSYSYHDFPDEWFARHLSKSARADGPMRAFLKADKSETKRFVYVSGPSGSGKSFFAFSFSRALAIKDKPIAFIDCNKRFDELKGLAISNKKAFEKAFDAISNAYLLVLDGFGSEYKSDYVRDQIVIPLLSARSRGKFLTIIVGDYPLSEIKTLYSNTRAGGLMADQLANIIAGNIDSEIVLKLGFDSLL